jgi:hypothetical protein
MRPRGGLRQNARLVEHTGPVHTGRFRFHQPVNAGAGLPTRQPPRHARCAGWGLPEEAPGVDTHGRVVGQLECLGRPLSDLLPARLAFVTRDLAVFVVSTGASRRHGLSLVGAVRGRTLRWFRHGSLPLLRTGFNHVSSACARTPTFPSPGCQSTPLGALSRRSPRPTTPRRRA